MYNFKINGVLVWLTILFIFSFSAKSIQAQSLCTVYSCPSVCTECDALITFTANGGNTDPGYFTIFALVDAQGIIQNLSTNNQFAVPSEGVWAVFGINYLLSEGINGLTIGQSIFGVNGNCFDISDPIIEKVCLDCYSDCDYFTGSTIQLNTTGGNNSPGYQTKYILTNAIGQILSINDTPFYQNLTSGYYFVYGINYYTTGVDNLNTATTISDISGSCFDLSDPYGFQVCLAGSIGDFVWYDLNGNGLQDNGENGMQGVTVTLYDGLGNIKGVTTTSASGYYIFNNLLPMDYYLVFTNPDVTQYLFSPQDRLFNDGLDSDVNSSGQTALLNLAAGENINNIDAGLYKGECITGMVWEDNLTNPSNLDDLFDNSDFLVQGLRVDLVLDPDINIIGDEVLTMTVFTDIDGNYSFFNVPIGQYYLVIHMPAGKMLTLSNAGNDDSIDNDFYFNIVSGENRTDVFSVPAQTDDICILDIDGGIREINDPLPVELLNYGVKWNEIIKVVEIDWATMNEINLDHYLIERVGENEKIFIEVSKILANGNLDFNEYNVQDENVEKGMRYFYRLRPVDKDGKIIRSYLADVLIPGEKIKVNVFPNPAKEIMNIEISGKVNNKLQIEFLDYTARKVIREIYIDANNNNTEIVSLDVTNIPQGLYIIKVISGNSVEIKQVTVLK